MPITPPVQNHNKTITATKTTKQLVFIVGCFLLRRKRIYIALLKYLLINYELVAINNGLLALVNF